MLRIPHLVLLFLIACSLIVLCAQAPSPPSETEIPVGPRLPNGRLQKDEILKADHDKNLEDARELMRLSSELRSDLEKDTAYVYSIGTVKKTEMIEKIAHRIRSRLKRQ